MSNMIQVTDQTFHSDVLRQSCPVLVDFWAPACAPCIAMLPTLEALADEFAGRVVFCKVNVDDNIETAAQYGIRSMPYLALFRHGQLVDKILGATSKAKIKAMLTRENSR